jgi:hypothetical protein
MDWLRLVATTRLGSDSFPIGHGPLQFLEIASLDEDNAEDLIRNHQPPLDADGLRRDFPPATAAAAREIARELGGFALAVESVPFTWGCPRTPAATGWRAPRRWSQNATAP